MRMPIKVNRKLKEGEERRRVILESDAALNQHISATLRAIRAARAQARNHDAELTQLRDETRSLIAEMQRDLNLKVA